MCHVAISTELSAVEKFGVVALQNRGEPPNKLLKTDHLTRIEQTASFMCVWWVASEENHFPKRQTIFVCFEELNCKKLILQTPKNQYFTELKSRVFFFLFLFCYTEAAVISVTVKHMQENFSNWAVVLAANFTVRLCALPSATREGRKLTLTPVRLH